MSKLILINSDVYIRSFLDSGAFSEIEDNDTYYLAASSVRNLDTLQKRKHYLSTIELDNRRTSLYTELSYIMMVGYRNRSSTFRLKTEARFRGRHRLKYKFLGAPALRSLVKSMILHSAGINRVLQKVLLDVKPDLVIAPSAMTDPLLIDVARLSKLMGIPTLFLINGWDNLSSKLVFPVNPDYLGVWGEQSVEHAVTIHKIDRSRVYLLGVPTFDHYFRVDRDKLARPYPFRYVLFAGCAIAFDEISALRTLDEIMESRDISDFKIVYRPHPWRHPRACFDIFEPEKFRHVVIDQQVRESYFRTIKTKDYSAAKSFLPSLDYYPRLLSHAEFVVCPLSTMILESAIFDTQVLVIAYDDHVHALSPDKVINEEHFKGIERIEGFWFCRDLSDLGMHFLQMVERLNQSGPRWKRTSLICEQIRQYLYFDDRTYAQRLHELVEHLAKINGLR